MENGYQPKGPYLDLDGIFPPPGGTAIVTPTTSDKGDTDKIFDIYGVLNAMVNHIENNPTENPYRDPLPGLCEQRKELLADLRKTLFDIVQMDKQIMERTQKVIVGYPGETRFSKWLQKRAWRRIFMAHERVIGKMMRMGHCADHWECQHDDSISCDEAEADRIGIPI